MSASQIHEERFPDDVIVLMHEANVTVSCVPIQMDEGSWLAALFFVLPSDAPCLADAQQPVGPFSVEFDAELHEHANGTLIEVGLTIDTPIEPSCGTLLFLTGHSPSHFDALKLICEQSDIPLFLGDEHCRVLYRQRVPVSRAMQSGFQQFLDKAVARDALIRLSGHYDPEKVFNDVLVSLQLVL